tara:strand:+ start:1217 stop:2113 length:897 start_codon:yes stop_codon:yes gene_type:complete
MSSENVIGGTYGVEVPGEVADALFTTDETSDTVTETVGESTTEEQSASPSEEQPESSELEPSIEENEEFIQLDELHLDDEVYSVDQLREALEDNRNKKEWQTSNTQKAQILSDERKALKAKIDDINAVVNDEDTMNTLKDVLGDDHPLLKTLNETIEVSTSNEPEPEEVNTKSDDRVTQLEDRIAQMEVQKAVDAEIAQLIHNHPELGERPDAVAEVINTALERNIPSLEDAFTLASNSGSSDSSVLKAIQSEAKAKELKSIPESDGKARGDHEVKVKKAGSYDEAREIAFDKYNIFK